MNINFPWPWPQPQQFGAPAQYVSGPVDSASSRVETMLEIRKQVMELRLSCEAAKIMLRELGLSPDDAAEVLK